MSEISSNFGMESLNVAMLKRSSDNQGQMALALLEGAVQTSQQIQNLTGRKTAHVPLLLLPLPEVFYRFPEVLRAMHP